MFAFADGDAEGLISTLDWTWDDYGTRGPDIANAHYPNRRCPGCGAPVVFTRRESGDEVMSFFVKHKVDPESCNWQPESPEHEAAKLAIVRSLRTIGWDAVPENRRQDGRAIHIPDVEASKDGRRVVFEVQFSPQSAEEYIRRQVVRVLGGADESWWLAGPKTPATVRERLVRLGFPVVDLIARGERVVDARREHEIGDWARLAVEREHDESTVWSSLLRFLADGTAPGKEHQAEIAKLAHLLPEREQLQLQQSLQQAADDARRQAEIERAERLAKASRSTLRTETIPWPMQFDLPPEQVEVTSFTIEPRPGRCRCGTETRVEVPVAAHLVCLGCGVDAMPFPPLVSRFWRISQALVTAESESVQRQSWTSAQEWDCLSCERPVFPAKHGEGRGRRILLVGGPTGMSIPPHDCLRSHPFEIDRLRPGMVLDESGQLLAILEED